jgi:hypothetical protein
MHCAFISIISHTFLARNYLLASFFAAQYGTGRRDAAVRASWLRAEKNGWCYALRTARPFYCQIAVAQGVVAAGRRAAIQVHNGVALYDGTPLARSRHRNRRWSVAGVYLRVSTYYCCELFYTIWRDMGCGWKRWKDEVGIEKDAALATPLVLFYVYTGSYQRGRGPPGRGTPGNGHFRLDNSDVGQPNPTGVPASPRYSRSDPTYRYICPYRLVFDEISLRQAAQSEPVFGPFGPPGSPRGHDSISLRQAAQSEPVFGPFGPPGSPRAPLPPSQIQKSAGAESSPPCVPPLRRCAAPGWAAPSRKAPPSAEDRG